MGKITQILVAGLMVFMALPALAQTSGSPLDITAEQTLEWHRDKREFIARGDVVAAQGGMKIHSETLTATYSEGAEGGSFDVRTLTAQNNVRIESEDGTAYGEFATYSVETGKATLKGDNSRLVSDNVTVYGTQGFEYDVPAGKMVTLEGGKAVQTTEKGENTITSDQLVVTFHTDEERAEQASSDREMKTMEAHGNVVIITPTETITGDKLVYDKKTNTADMTGNVHIKREQNTLEGSRAKVNLTTNVSTLYGGTDGRVKGTFYPSGDSAFSDTP